MLRRIVSLVPSWSETLAAWGLQPELVGCTQFCILPRTLHRSAQIVGGTKDFSVAAIQGLRPTHIIVNQEENPKDRVEELARDFPVLLTFPRSPTEVPETLRSMGRFLACIEAAEDTARAIEAELRGIQDLGPSGRKFLYFIWQEPYMVAGRDTYISNLLGLCGWENACRRPERYPVLSLDAIQGCEADWWLLSSEPYPFRRRDAARMRREMPAAPRLAKVDGRLLSWYGASTVEALRYVKERSRAADWQGI